MQRLAAIALVVGWTAAGAQQPVDPARQLLDDIQRRALEREERREPPKIETKPEVAPKPAPEDSVCFEIDRIDLEGSIVLAPKVRDDILARYAGRCLFRRDINAVLAALTEAYAERGYITTRVYIPAQKLSTRILRLLVIEGRIERIKLNDDAAADARRASTAFPVAAGEILRLQDLEQGLDQLNRVPSSRARLQLEPGAAPGGSIVVVQDRQQDRFRGTAGWDNYGQKSTGERRFSFGVEVDNLLSLNDAWALYYVGSLDSNAVAATSSFGFGNWTLGGLFSYSESLQRLTADADLFGRFAVAGMFLEWLFERSPTTKTNLVAQFDRRASRRQVNDVELAPQNLAVGRVGVRHQLRLDKELLSIDGTLSSGTVLLGATRDAPSISSDQPRAQFTKLDAGVSWLGRLAPGTLRSTLKAQYSRDALYSSEQMVVGGASTVRGYAEAATSGDKGWYIRNELTFDLPRTLLEFRGRNWTPHFQPYAFADGGEVRLVAGDAHRSLGSVGIGLRLAGTRISFDISIAYPFIRNDLPRQEFQARMALQLW